MDEMSHRRDIGVEYVERTNRRIEDLSKHKARLRAQINMQLAAWYGIPSYLIPDSLQNQISGERAYIEEIEREIYELRAKVRPYCLPLLKRYGVAFHDAYRNFTGGAISSSTLVVNIPSWHLSSGSIYRYFVPTPQRIELDITTISPKVEGRTYIIEFEWFGDASAKLFVHIKYMDELDTIFIAGEWREFGVEQS